MKEYKEIISEIYRIDEMIRLHSSNPSKFMLEQYEFKKEELLGELREDIKKYNEAYRLGNPLISDSEYDQLLEQLALLSPNDELLTKVGIEISDETRKVKLPIVMGSMSKVKSYEELIHWLKLKNIPIDCELILTPKLDGLSFVTDEVSGFTRGDGVYGQRSDDHYKLIGNKFKEVGKFTFGEIMMSRTIFNEKYSDEYKNSRNLVAGQINNKNPQPILKDMVLIRYGIDDDSFDKKSDQLDYLNKNQEIKIPFKITTIDKLSDDNLKDLFYSWNTEYELDGIIVELNDIEIRNKLGRETSSNNPHYARAYKANFEEVKETIILEINWHISKNSLLKPVAKVEKVSLDGAVVEFCTLNNAKFVKDNGIGVGSIITIKRSGGVIPKIVDVIKRIDFEMPKVEGGVKWNDSGIELVVLAETDEQSIKKIISFFEILEADNVGEGVITQLYNAGYKTIKQILSLTKGDLEKIDRFGKRKSTIIYDSIKKSTSDVPLSKLQHASNLFENLGSKKLILLDHFTEKPTMDQLMSIEGFAEISSKSYLEGIDKFKEFIKDLPITIKKEQEKDKEKMENDLEGMSFCFSGVRRKDLELVIENKSGKISSGVSKNTTHLILKDLESTSSKTVKAKELGIEILSVDELEKLLGL